MRTKMRLSKTTCSLKGGYQLCYFNVEDKYCLLFEKNLFMDDDHASASRLETCCEKLGSGFKILPLEDKL